MSCKQKQQEKKCIAVQLPVNLVKKLDDYKGKTGKSKNKILVEFIKNGLEN